MASELLKRNTLIQRLKEPNVAPIDFGLQSTGFEELFTLPETKPEELLNIQEENRKFRLIDSLNEIGGGLEDTSLDFINRQNFANGTPDPVSGKLLSKKVYELIKKFGVEKYKKLNANQRAAIRKGDPGIRFMSPEKFEERSKRLRPVFKGKGSKKGETPKVVDVSGPKELKEEYINDFKKRLQYPKAGREFRAAVEKGEVLSNPQLANKYGITVGEVERLNSFFIKQEDLKYQKGTPASGSDLRKRRLQLNQPGTYISGKGKIQFHHIMPIGGDVDLTSKDVAFINKYVNASLQKYNTPLNRIADGISNNLAKYSETKDTVFLKRVDDLNIQAAQIVDKTKKELPKKLQGLIGFNKITPVLDENATLINTTVERIGIDEAKTAVGKKGPTVKLSDMRSGTYTPLKFQKEAGEVAKKLTSNDSKNIAKKLASFGFKCSASEGGACDNPMNYLNDIKKQQTIAKGSGNAAANAVKKLSAGKAIIREFIGPAALGVELAVAVPITFLGYKAGLPPARIVADATYGIFGDTEKARLKKEAVKAGIDTSEIQKSLDFEKASSKIQSLVQQESEFRGPDDEMQFPQQYEKGEEDFYKAVGAFTDEEGDISKDVFKKYGSQLEGLRDYIAKLDADTAAERTSKIPTFGIGDYIDFNSGGRVSFADGPNNPKRRQFMKIMAGIASLPIVGKFFKGAKSAKVVKLANTSTTMPDWFPAFVEKAFERGVVKKIDADLQTAELPELPGIEITKHDDGRVFVGGKNEYGKSYEIEYEPPGYEVIDETTGKAVKTKGEFIAQEEVPINMDPDGNVDFDVDVLENLDNILGSDTRVMEEFATGKKLKEMKRGEFEVNRAEVKAQQAADEAAELEMFDEID